MALCMLFTSASILAAEPAYLPPSVSSHDVHADAIGETFRIQVALPVRKADGSEKFPVLYATDVDGLFGLAEISQMMQLGGDVPRFIVVGIGYPVSSLVEAIVIRWRELTPTAGEKLARPLPEGVSRPPFKGLLIPARESGGARAFLNFLERSVFPLIDKTYPTLPHDRAYWGDSLGGLFGLYVLFDRPETFQRYIIGSPSIWWDSEWVMKQADGYIASHADLDATVFMGVGALEESLAASRSRMVSNVLALEQKLARAEFPSLHLSTHLFPDETHTSVVYMSFARGIKAVYGPAKVSFMEEARKAAIQPGASP